MKVESILQVLFMKVSLIIKQTDSFYNYFKFRKKSFEIPTTKIALKRKKAASLEANRENSAVDFDREQNSTDSEANPTSYSSDTGNDRFSQLNKITKFSDPSIDSKQTNSTQPISLLKPDTSVFDIFKNKKNSSNCSTFQGK